VNIQLAFRSAVTRSVAVTMPALCGCATYLAASVAHADTPVTVLYSFTSTTGANPQDGVTLGADGRLYGTTQYGGPSNDGVIFSVAADGSDYQLLHTFSGSDGYSPLAGLTVGTNGLFYGTTFGGGTYQSGTVFSVTAQGDYTLLHSFQNNPAQGIIEGINPYARPVLASDGLLYGTTFGVFGSAYKVTTSGIYSLLCLGTAGTPQTCPNFPESALTQLSDGNFYGTSYGGGDSSPPLGTVYKLSANGTYTTLHSFTGPDGSQPRSELTQGSDGYLYGTTLYGGIYNYGTIFKILPDGQNFTVIHSFNNSTDGSYPIGRLTLAKDGYFYGVAGGAGLNGQGTLFKISANDEFSVVHTFKGAEGTIPRGVLTEDETGTLYGTTLSGGAYGSGVIYSFNPLLPKAPAGLSATAGNGHSVLSWSSATDAVSYNVYEGLSAGNEGSTPILTGLTATTVDVTGLTNGSAYYFTVAAVNDHGTGPMSNETSARPLDKPTISITTSPSTLQVPYSSLLSWSTSYATSCSAVGDWTGTKAIAGSTTIAPTAVGVYNYGLSCTGVGGTSSASATLTVTLPPPPTVSLTISNTYVRVTEKYHTPTLAWSSSYATACTASGDWSGALPIVGSAVAPLVPSSTNIPYTTDKYTITCAGYGGSASAEVDLLVLGK